MALLEGDLTVTGSLDAGEIRGLRQECRIAGDGRTRQFEVTHQLGLRRVLPTLYDSSGRIIYAEFQTVSASLLKVVFFNPPKAGEIFDLVVRR